MSQLRALLRANVANGSPLKRLLSNQSATTSKTAGAAAPKADNILSRVQGLSGRCVVEKSGPLGPGAAVDGEYKTVEYFQYHKGSYHEAEIEMQKYRIPQPSSRQ